MLAGPNRSSPSAPELRITAGAKACRSAAFDAVLTQLCIRHDLTMLTADEDFRHVAKHAPLKVWAAA